MVGAYRISFLFDLSKERCNFTVQNRLPNDVIRFGITDYDTLNVWFSDFYAPYINAKFSFEPLEPQSAFTRLDEKTDLSRILRTRDTRIGAEGSSPSPTPYICW